VASLSQGRTAAAQCGLFTHKSVPVIFEPPCIYDENYPTEFLNSFDTMELLQLILNLENGAQIMLLRNLNPLTLCNATRLAVEQQSTVLNYTKAKNYNVPKYTNF